jgi:hypothetical protein
MGTGFGNWLNSLVVQLPLIAVCAIGATEAIRRHGQQPEAVRRVLFAFTLLLIDAVVLSGVVFGLIAYAASQPQDLNLIHLLITGVGLGRNLIHAWAVWLLFRTIFPALGGSAPRWLRRLFGALAGLVVGALLAIIVGDPLAEAAGISNFEGARGFFVVFALAPLLALAGAVAGALLSGLSFRAGHDAQ